MTEEKTCELCGTKVKVMGRTTHHYEPIIEPTKEGPLTVEEIERKAKKRFAAYGTLYRGYIEGFKDGQKEIK